MKLNDKLEICRAYDDEFKELPIEFSRTYLFRYGIDYKVKLAISLDNAAYLPSDYIPVLNFGYTVDIFKFNRRNISFQYLRDADPQSGSSTKEIITHKESRRLLFGFVKKTISKYLAAKMPPIILRGPITNFKKSNYRYEEITKLIESFGYKKTVILAKDIKYKPSEEFIENKESDEYWFFTKKNIEPDKLKNITK
jgi:hypothetical protein